MIRRVVKEVKRRDNIPVWQIVSILMISIIFINFLITESNRLKRSHAYIVSISILVISIALFAYFLYKRLINYIYILDEDELIFKKGIKENDNTKLIVRKEELEWIKPMSECKKCKNIKRTYKFIFKKDKTKVYVGQFIRNGKKHRFLFTPGKKMKKALNLEPVHI